MLALFLFPPPCWFRFSHFVLKFAFPPLPFTHFHTRPFLSLSPLFSGGLDVLFGGQKSINCQVPSKTDGSQLLLPDILKFMKDELLEERPELFLQGDTVYVFYFF